MRQALVASPLWDAVKACRPHLVFAAIFSALLNLLYLAPTLYMLQVYDRVVPTRSHLSLLFLTLVLLLSLFVLSALDYARGRLLVRAGAMLDHQLARVVIDATLKLRAEVGASVSNRAMRDFDTLRQTLTGQGILALFDLPWTPVYIIISFLIHPALGALALGGVALLFGLAYLNDRMTHNPLKAAGEATSLSYLSQQQSIANADAIQALGMRSAFVQKHLGERLASTRLQMKASFEASSHNALARFVRLALQSLSLGLGAYLAVEQKISAGGIFAASLLVGRALAPIDQILAASKNLNQGRDAFTSLLDMFAAGANTSPATRLPPPTGDVRVEQLGVMNPQRNAYILQDMSFAIAAGDIVGVIGPSGAGKSTLVRAMAGAVAVDRGTIRFDGANADHWDREELARYVGFMPQETTLFAGTIKENISRFRGALGDPAETIDEDVIAAAKLCGAHDLIQRLPGGYDTPLGAGGRGLSAGHSQRIALARALYGQPRVVILDEPNAHLDVEGETLLSSTLQELKKRKVTVIVVAHRPGILAAIDQLLLLRDGRIEAYGPRDEILAQLNGARGPRPPAPARAR